MASATTSSSGLYHESIRQTYKTAVKGEDSGRQQVQYFEFRGTAPPDPSVGGPGDIYIDENAKQAYGKRDDGWKRFEGINAEPVIHPHITERLLFPANNMQKMSWPTIKTKEPFFKKNPRVPEDPTLLVDIILRNYNSSKTGKRKNPDAFQTAIQNPSSPEASLMPSAKKRKVATPKASVARSSTQRSAPNSVASDSANLTSYASTSVSQIDTVDFDDDGSQAQSWNEGLSGVVDQDSTVVAEGSEVGGVGNGYDMDYPDSYISSDPYSRFNGTLVDVPTTHHVFPGGGGVHDNDNEIDLGGRTSPSTTVVSSPSFANDTDSNPALNEKHVIVTPFVPQSPITDLPGDKLDLPLIPMHLEIVFDSHNKCYSCRICNLLERSHPHWELSTPTSVLSQHCLLEHHEMMKELLEKPTEVQNDMHSKIKNALRRGRRKPSVAKTAKEN